MPHLCLHKWVTYATNSENKLQYCKWCDARQTVPKTGGLRAFTLEHDIPIVNSPVEGKIMKPVDVFLMGTISAWREPYKILCKRLGLSFYDPQIVGRPWTEEDGRIEAEMLNTCKIVVMAITTDTDSHGSLTESGYVLARAIVKKQKFGLLLQQYTDPAEVAAHDASNRARKLAFMHGNLLDLELDNVFIASTHDQLQAWLVDIAMTTDVSKG